METVAETVAETEELANREGGETGVGDGSGGGGALGGGEVVEEEGLVEEEAVVEERWVEGEVVVEEVWVEMAEVEVGEVEVGEEVEVEAGAEVEAGVGEGGGGVEGEGVGRGGKGVLGSKGETVQGGMEGRWLVGQIADAKADGTAGGSGGATVRTSEAKTERTWLSARQMERDAIMLACADPEAVPDGATTHSFGWLTPLRKAG
ncbi:hypothetical protein CYMTET_12609 [Cymbomonas tetramitiformis]|uniref:Uncharacterized protein n=1 Tax=Cymbomonas tetramitiformis TaxID=36881 RepID=A0AAE0LCA2_9CHLO|nr:hypothetical protein CYMTET_12609 [Cymbomonas tetramitiformis]